MTLPAKVCLCQIGEAFKHCLADFVRQRGTPHSAMQTLLLPKTIGGPRRGKSGVFALSKVKKGPNRASNGPKMTKNKLKRAKIPVL